MEDLNEIVRATLAWRATDLRANEIALDEQYAGELPLIIVNREEIQQVILNLLLNAEHTMRAAGQRGKLQVRTRAGDGTVAVEIADEGPGVPHDTAARIFEPFFTTKFVGEGTGLGLSVSLGIAEGAYDEALRYAGERKQFGRAIGSFQGVSFQLADMATEIEAARLLTYKAAVLKDQGRNFTLTAAQAKLKTGRLAVRATEEAVQIHGGYGYIEEYPVCRFYRDAKILTIGEGTDEVQQMVIARALGA